MLTGYFIFLLRMLVQRNLARTTQPARLVLQTEITSVCAFPDLLALIVNKVGNTLTQLSFLRSLGGDWILEGRGANANSSPNGPYLNLRAEKRSKHARVLTVP